MRDAELVGIFFYGSYYSGAVKYQHHIGLSEWGKNGGSKYCN